MSSPASRKTGLPAVPARPSARPSGCFVLSHPNIDTRKISCSPWARPVPWSPDLALLWPQGQQGRQASSGLICLHSAFLPGQGRPSQPSAGQRDEGAAALVHSRVLQASWWPPTTKPERARDFLETSWNCSEQREKQPDSRGVHSVRGRGSKTPLIVYKRNRVTTNRMPSREGEAPLGSASRHNRTDPVPKPLPFIREMIRSGETG